MRVVTAFIIHAHRVLLIQRLPKPGWPEVDYVFATPGGRIEQGETDVQALARELCEELGLDVPKAAINKVAYTANLGPPDLPTDVELTCYVLRWSDALGVPRALDGVAGFAWFDVDTVLLLPLAPSDRVNVQKMVACLKEAW